MTKLQINGHQIDDTTTFEFAPNPKRPHAKVYARYQAYSQATNLEEYNQLSEAHDGHKRNIMPSLRYDEAHGHLKFYDEEHNQINIHEE